MAKTTSKKNGKNSEAESKVDTRKIKGVSNFKKLYKVKKKVKNYKFLENRYIFKEDILISNEHVKYIRIAYNDKNFKMKLISKKKYVTSLKDCEYVILTVPSAIDTDKIIETTGAYLGNALFNKYNPLGNTMKGICMSFKQFKKFLVTDEGKNLINFITDIDRHSVCLMTKDNKPIVFVLA